VLLSVSESKGIESDLIPKIATGLCGGVSNTDGMCGALTGAILAINMIDGRSDANADREVNKTKIQQLVNSFEHEFKSKRCYELCGHDLSTVQGQMDYNINEAYEICDKLVDFATNKTLELIDQDK